MKIDNLEGNKGCWRKSPTAFAVHPAWAQYNMGKRLRGRY